MNSLTSVSWVDEMDEMIEFMETGNLESTSEAQLQSALQQERQEHTDVVNTMATKLLARSHEAAQNTDSLIQQMEKTNFLEAAQSKFDYHSQKINEMGDLNSHLSNLVTGSDSQLTAQKAHKKMLLDSLQNYRHLLKAPTNLTAKKIICQQGERGCMTLSTYIKENK